jgi:peptide/nickel transport system permease protein
MIRYTLNRLLVFIPMLVMISILAFVVSVSSPGDPINRLLSGNQEESADAKNGNPNLETDKKALRHQLGLDLPVFYLSIHTLADIDTILRFEQLDEHAFMQGLARESGRPELVVQWINQVHLTSAILDSLKPDSIQSTPSFQSDLSACRNLIESLCISQTITSMDAKQDSISLLLGSSPLFSDAKLPWENSLQLTEQLKTEKQSWKKWIPKICWSGLQNQYHRWMFGDGEERKGIIRGDFGLSFRDGQPISDRILPRFKWTLGIASISIILAFFVGIPTGVIAGSKVGSWFDRMHGIIAFAMLSLPGFFVATGLLVLFSNPDVLDWFPSSGVKDLSTFDPNWTFWKRVQHYAPFLILPIFCFTYASAAFISVQVRNSIREQMKQDYIRTARAKGISETRILIHHALRNSLSPIITLFGQSLPMLFGGSVIIESIFSIPGMGLEIYESVINYDYPMIVALFTIIGLLTMLGNLISDILYAWADPRVRYTSANDRI